MESNTLDKQSSIDGHGFLLVNEKSVEALNQKLTSFQVRHRSFRPNIVVKGK